MSTIAIRAKRSGDYNRGVEVQSAMDEAWKLGIRPTGHKEPPPQPLPPQPDPAWMIAMGQLRDQLDAARAAHLADLRKLVFSANHKEVDREKDDIEFKGNFP